MKNKDSLKITVLYERLSKDGGQSDTEVYVTDLHLTGEVIEILKNNQTDTALFCNEIKKIWKKL